MSNVVSAARLALATESKAERASRREWCGAYVRQPLPVAETAPNGNASFAVLTIVSAAIFGGCGMFALAFAGVL